MVEGAIRPGTTMTVEGNYTDTCGRSEIGLAIVARLPELDDDLDEVGVLIGEGRGSIISVASYDRVC